MAENDINNEPESIQALRAMPIANADLKLIAFLEGLEIEQMGDFIRRADVESYGKLARLMAERTKEIIAKNHQPWVPVTERLPRHADEKWITCEWPEVFDDVAVVHGRWVVDHWQVEQSGDYCPFDGTVFAWKETEPIPEPYTEAK